MLNSSRDKNEDTHRSGEGGGLPAMCPGSEIRNGWTLGSRTNIISGIGT